MRMTLYESHSGDKEMGDLNDCITDQHSYANYFEIRLTSLDPGTGSTVRAAWFPT